MPILEQLRKYEPQSMAGQPPILWDRAEGIQVFDRWGNQWLDFSSGVVVTNAGHGHPKSGHAIIDQLTERQAVCVKLHFLEGYSQGEIAERLGITKQSVSEHLAAAKKKLAILLREVPDKVPSRAVLTTGKNERTTYEDLMAEPVADEERSVPLLFPFELWLRHNEGARWNRYGVYRPIVRNRLPEYLAACFDIPPVVGSWSSPRSGKKSSPANGINMAERLT